MNRDDVGRICKLIVTAQGRDFTPDDLELWEDAVGDLNGELAYQATRSLIRETTQFLTPALIRQKYAAMATSRLEVAGTPKAPQGLEQPEFTAWLRAYRSAVIAGGTREEASSAALAAVGRSPDDDAVHPAPEFALPGPPSDRPVVEGAVVKE